MKKTNKTILGLFFSLTAAAILVAKPILEDYIPSTIIEEANQQEDQSLASSVQLPNPFFLFLQGIK